MRRELLPWVSHEPQQFGSVVDQLRGLGARREGVYATDLLGQAHHASSPFSIVVTDLS